jgi:hypothetical protein
LLVIQAELTHRSLAQFPSIFSTLQESRLVITTWPNLQAFWPVLLAGGLRFRRHNAVCADILYGHKTGRPGGFSGMKIAW